MNSTPNIHISKSSNPFFNLATEEWLIKNYDSTKGDLFFLYVNEPAIVVGRNQNLLAEVNLAYCKSNKIHICRRVSGGGTVFHDFGNLNWCIISKFDFKKVNRYEYFASSIIDLLKSYHLEAYLNDRNGIEINGLKISGQAQFTNKTNILSHGTLLINSNVEKLQPAIFPLSNIEVETKASKSVRSKVLNLKDLLGATFSMDDFMQRMSMNKVNYPFTDETILAIKEIEEKYKSDEWIFNRSPKCSIRWESDMVLYIEKGKIIRVENKSGQIQKNHPLLDTYYKDLFMDSH